MEATLSYNENNIANHYWDLISRLSYNVKLNLEERLSKSIREERREPSAKERIIKEKFKSLEISPEVRRLSGCIRLSDLDLEDERTKYILSK